MGSEILSSVLVRKRLSQVTSSQTQRSTRRGLRPAFFPCWELWHFEETTDLPVLSFPTCNINSLISSPPPPLDDGSERVV